MVNAALNPFTPNLFAQLAFPQASLLNAASAIPPFALPSLLNAFSAAQGSPAMMQSAFIPPFLSMPPPAMMQPMIAPIAGGGYAPPQRQSVDLAPFQPNNFLSRLLNPERRAAAQFERVLRNDPFARQSFEQAVGGRIVDFGGKNDGRFTIERYPVSSYTPGPGAAFNPTLGGLYQQMDRGIMSQLGGLALGGLGGGLLGGVAGSAFGNPFLGLALGGMAGIAGQLLGSGGRGGFDSFQGGVQGFPLFGGASASWNPLAQPGKINGSNMGRELAGTAQVSSVMNDPSLTMEDKIMLALMLICSKMDDDIKRQTEYLNNLQNQQGNRKGGGGLLGGIGSKLGGASGGSGQDGEKSIDLETKKLERIITKRATLFDTLGKIMERYDQSAKSVIQSMRG